MSKFLTGLQLRAPVCVKVSDWFAICARLSVSRFLTGLQLRAPVCVKVYDWLARGSLRYAGKDLRNQRTVNRQGADRGANDVWVRPKGCLCSQLIGTTQLTTTLSAMHK